MDLTKESRDAEILFRVRSQAHGGSCVEVLFFSVGDVLFLEVGRGVNQVCHYTITLESSCRSDSTRVFMFAEMPMLTFEMLSLSREPAGV